MNTKDDFEVEPITLDVEGQEIKVHFVFLDDGDLTACFIKGHQFKNIDRHDQARKRVPVNGMAARNPQDEPNRDYAMRLAMWRACCNLDGIYQYNQENNGHDGWGLGPIGKKIYAAFREYQWASNFEGTFFPELENLISETKAHLVSILKVIITAFEEKAHE
jgi:hypothetical protein